MLKVNVVLKRKTEPSTSSCRYGSYTSFQRIAYSMFLYAPIVIVVCMSALIAVTVLNRSHSPVASSNASRREKDRRKERQAFLQLALIVCSFLFGYIPFTGNMLNTFLFLSFNIHRAYKSCGDYYILHYPNIIILH